MGSKDHNTALVGAGSLVVSPNGKTQTEISMTDLVPYGGQPTLVDMHDGIGIVKFIRGKVFLITGATGFLGKGKECLNNVCLYAHKKLYTS